MSPLSAAATRRRFIALTALRWLPTGLLIPVFVLLPLDRGLSLSELGAAVAFQGIVVLALELPTGGLADTLGRRRVLMVSTLISMGSLSIILVADTFALFAVAFALQGVFRALDSGPLEAWYVDATLAADHDARIERGLSAGTVAIGVAISGGALASGGIVVLDPIPGVNALAVPVLGALLMQIVGLVGLAVLMTEIREPIGLRATSASVRAVPHVIRESLALLRRSRVLLGIVMVELFWGFSAVTYESLPAVKLADILGDADQAAAVIGPATSVAWLASAAGAALVPWLTRRTGVATAAAAFRVLQGVTVLGIGLSTGVVGVIAAYLACYAVHGASNPAHMTLLHRQVEGNMRATVVSLNSMAAQSAGALGVFILTVVADGTSVSLAIAIGAAALAVSAPLYLPAWRQERAQQQAQREEGLEHLTT